MICHQETGKSNHFITTTKGMQEMSSISGWYYHMIRDSIFVMAFSIAGMFFLKADHCSSVRLIPESTREVEILYNLKLSKTSNFKDKRKRAGNAWLVDFELT